jgi:hypothetical protein
VSLETLGDLGDFVGGFAVVISLVYLVFQIRQNTGQVRQSLEVARAQALRETVSTGWPFEVARDPALAKLYSRGLQQPEQLTDDERVRLLFLMGTIFGEIEKNYLMYEQALLTPERWEAQLVTLRFHVKQPGGVYYWERFSNTHTRAFIQVVDRQRAGRSSASVLGKGSE